MNPSDSTAAGARNEMHEAARRFLEALSDKQLQQAQHSFSADARTDMSYFPGDRAGLPLKEMLAEQQELARALLRSALSETGALKAKTIMELEQVLRDMGGGSHRDPELYYFAVFGDPKTPPWGWRAEGHHLSINLTFTGQGLADTPSFFGADPAVVREGEKIVSRPLAAEEDLARELVTSFDTKKRGTAIISTKAPRDIITGTDRRVSPGEPAGLPYAMMNAEQQELLVRLIREYIDRHRAELAGEDWEAIEAAGLEKLHFAWAGGMKPGEGHYYRIQGPTFLMEYDNTQDHANHIHTVWRNFEGDYGFDALRDHYETTPTTDGRVRSRRISAGLLRPGSDGALPSIPLRGPGLIC